MLVEFRVYGGKIEFVGYVTLLNLQRLADIVFSRTGRAITAIVSDHETRRELIRVFATTGMPGDITYIFPALEVRRDLAPRTIWMKPA